MPAKKNKKKTLDKTIELTQLYWKSYGFSWDVRTDHGFGNDDDFEGEDLVAFRPYEQHEDEHGEPTLDPGVANIEPGTDKCIGSVALKGGLTHPATLQILGSLFDHSPGQRLHGYLTVSEDHPFHKNFHVKRKAA